MLEDYADGSKRLPGTCLCLSSWPQQPRPNLSVAQLGKAWTCHDTPGWLQALANMSGRKWETRPAGAGPRQDSEENGDFADMGAFSGDAGFNTLTRVPREGSNTWLGRLSKLGESGDPHSRRQRFWSWHGWQTMEGEIKRIREMGW